MNIEQIREIDSVNELNSESEIPVFLRLDETGEFAPSMEVQTAEICEVFRDIPELQFENWQELSIEQRTEALNAFETEIAGIEMRNAMPVEHEDLGVGMYGYYDGTKIVVSDSLIGSNSYEAYREVLDTLLHEGRHAYQSYNLDIRQTEQSEILVDAWKVNLQELGYDSASTFDTLFATRGFHRYYTQPIEVDARHFAETVMNKLCL